MPYQLCWFRCKSATVYVLHNFSNVLADWYFSWLYSNFHWLSFCWFFTSVFSPGLRKKNNKKSLQKIFLHTQSKISVHIVFHDLYKNVFGRISFVCFFWETIFQIWSLTFFSFMMISFFEILNKTFGKLTIYFSKTLYCLSCCVPIFILTL